MIENSQRKEPIAIIGMACRFPGGATNLDSFWQLLINREDAICDVPHDRWDIRQFYSENPNKSGKTNIKQGGFLQEPIDQFDPLFFGISPREASCMDPQQRLLLEVCWAAFEDGGIPLEKAQRLDTSVFVGGFCLDNKLLQLSGLNREQIDQYTATSSTMAILANRLSYIFDLKGPSLTIDTACSSSLVAIHYACQSIWHQESEMAIAAGVNIMFQPEYPIAMSKAQLLSPQMRCMTFDKRANGYARGEGAGVILLKPLSAAQRDHDQIYAQILATGVNQDGRTTGISKPNGQAQQDLLKRVYQQAQVSPQDIGFIESHGTGTQAGDITEMSALQAVFDEVESTTPLKRYVGSVKTNLGHLEAAAGIAGVIKTALCLHHKTIVPNLHFEIPNPNINFDQANLTVPTEVKPWPTEKAFASVNSFGYGGTNAHAVLRSASSKAKSSKPSKSSETSLFCISANHKKGLKALAQEYMKLLDNQGNNPQFFNDLVYSTQQRRTHCSHRLAVVAESLPQLKSQLKTYLKDGYAEQVTTGTVKTERKLVFVYTGMGPQWFAMGRELAQAYPLVNQTLQTCDDIFQSIAGWSLLKEMQASKSKSRMAETQIAQPANFFLQLVLTALWKSWGIEPDAVIGHSVGEVAAAYISGALSLEDAICVSYHRSRLQQSVAGKGKMLAVALDEHHISELIKDIPTLSIAAYNSPHLLTLSGDEDDLIILAKKFKLQNIFHQFLNAEVAYHSHQMEPIQQELTQALNSLSPQIPTIPLYSTVTGQRLKAATMDENYWWENVRHPVQFAKAAQHLFEQNHSFFLEIGPHPVLKNALIENAATIDTSIEIFQSLNRKSSETTTMLESLGRFHANGFSINRNKLCSPNSNYIKLPHYPWQKKTYWRESEVSRELRLGQSGSVWFYQNLRQPIPAWQVECNTAFFPYLTDHCLQEKIVFPGASYVEAGLQIHKKLSKSQGCLVENITFHQMLAPQPNDVQLLNLQFNPKTQIYTIYSAKKEDNPRWTCHSTGQIKSTDLPFLPSHKVDIESLKIQCFQTQSKDDLYSSLKKKGLNYGPCFQTIRSIQKNTEQVLAELSISPSLEEEETESPLHPTLLDGSFQSLLALVTSDSEQQSTYIPVHIDKILFYESVEKSCWSLAQKVSETESTVKGNITLINESGKILVEIKGITCKKIDLSTSSQKKYAWKDLFYKESWKKSGIPTFKETESDNIQKTWVIFSETRHLNWVRYLQSQGLNCVLVTKGKSFQEKTAAHIQINPERAADFELLVNCTSPENILYLWEHYEIPDDIENSDPILDAVMPLTYLTQSLKQKETNLTVITLNAQPFSLGSCPLDLKAASLSHFVQLIENENPHIHTKTIDFDSSSTAETLLEELIFGIEQDQAITWRKGTRYSKQLIRSFPSDIKEHGLESFNPSSHCLVLRNKEGLLSFEEYSRQIPKEDEIEFKVHYAALRSNDLLNFRGKISEERLEHSFSKNGLGLQASGVVTRVGDNITQYQPGHEVIALLPDACRSIAIVSDSYVIPKPDLFSFQQAPVLFDYLTAYYSLIHVGQLKENESVLIHNATTTRGLAAIQVARWKKAQIYTTAESEEKRTYLKTIGVKYVYDALSPHFEEQLNEDTNNKGIDAILNEFSNVILPQNIKMAGPNGRLIELYHPQHSTKTTTLNSQNILFSSVDMESILKEYPDLIQSLLQEILKGFEKEYFQPLQTFSIDADQIDDALRLVAQNDRIGSVHLNFDLAHIFAKPLQAKPLVDSQGSYLVTGGTSGFGLAVGQWLLEIGAGHVILVSRRGEQSPDVQTLLSNDSLKEKLTIQAVDIAQKTDVNQLINSLENLPYPLKGIIHSAMVLDDALLINLSKERYRRVFQPKIDGLINLVQATEHLLLDFFVSFSSLSSLISNPGQANYIVANSFLDAFAHFQKQKGRSITTINWGLLESTGVAGRNAFLSKSLERRGLHAISLDDAFKAISLAIKERPTQMGVFKLDWEQWQNAHLHISQSSLYSNFIQPKTNSNEVQQRKANFNKALLSLDSKERKVFIKNELSKQIALLLKIPIEELNDDMDLNHLGLDSLLSLELTIQLKQQMWIDFDQTDLQGEASISKMTKIFLDKWNHQVF